MGIMIRILIGILMGTLIGVLKGIFDGNFFMGILFMASMGWPYGSSDCLLYVKIFIRPSLEKRPVQECLSVVCCCLSVVKVCVRWSIAPLLKG